MELDHELIFKLLLSIVIGGAVGIERELRSKSAGFRTIILICLGATLFTVFSKFIGGANNPDRIASNVVVGIGFLGAGVIFRSDNNRVNGITTAASIWLSAALGMGIGCGYYFASLVGCILVVSVLFLFSFFDRFLERYNQLRTYKIIYAYNNKEHNKYELLMRQYGLSVKSRAQMKNGNTITGTWVAKGNEKNHHEFINYILDDGSVTEFGF
jgi:putative Mg2+ transporter-C (MgtC) family protein